MAAELGVDAGQPPAALPGLDADGGPAQPAPEPPGVRATRRSGRRSSRRSTGPAHRRGVRRRSRCRRPGRSRRASPLFDPAADPPVAFYDRDAARRPSRPPAGPEERRAGTCAGAKKPLAIELLSPDQSIQPGAYAAAEAVTARLEGTSGSRSPTRALPPGEFVTDRLATGEFAAAVADVTIGLDPDLYPLLASSQTLTGGSNIVGRPGSGPRQGCSPRPASRAPTRSARPPTRRSRSSSAKGRYLLPLAFADEAVVVRDTRPGTGRPAGRRPGRIDFGMC